MRKYSVLNPARLVKCFSQIIGLEHIFSSKKNSPCNLFGGISGKAGYADALIVTMDYRPNARARSFAKQKSGNVLFINDQYELDCFFVGARSTRLNI